MDHADFMAYVIVGFFILGLAIGFAIGRLAR
jgi:hypothetical protein